MASPSIEEFLEQELEQIETSRNLRLEAGRKATSAREGLIGLAFSGGGIRSATFNLGVLQAFAQARVLRKLDYISTVSGGGYIGSWLMAWMHHEKIGIADIEDRLAARPALTCEPGDPPEVHFLRDYSNYLTPRKGILGADFWAFAASYLRNAMLNLMILLLLLLALLFVPRAIVYLPIALEAEEIEWKSRIAVELVRSQNLAVVLGMVLALMAVIFMGLNLAWIEAHQGEKYPYYTKQWAIQVFIVAPLFVAAALVSYFGYSFIRFGSETGGTIANWPPILGAVSYFGLWFISFGVCSLVRSRRKFSGRLELSWPLVLVTAAVAGGLGGFLLLPFAQILRFALNDTGWPARLWHVLTFGSPALVGIMLLVGVLHIGLMGRGMPDDYREWWARLGGWLLIYCICWLFLFLMSIYVPVGLGRLWAAPFQKKYTFSLGTLIWIVSTLYGILFGKGAHSDRSLPEATVSRKLLSYLARATPYIFILGLLAGLSVLAAWITAALTGETMVLQSPPSDIVDVSALVACIVFFVVAVALSWRVDINEFSVHHLYRNRLVRCFLGASVRDRAAQPFTGFSAQDDLPLAALSISRESSNQSEGRPVPIINACLNVARGKELALQTRKARSFSFTPSYSGFARMAGLSTKLIAAYAQTSAGGSKAAESKGGISLGTAMAISGAAASPNMGFHSSPALAFLMTLFDVRLGWWIGNPNGRAWMRGSPLVGFYWLLCELFGAATDDSRYVYLSDGGHFENLGIYELVRRRCRVIVACDASCDPGYSFGDLQNAMERCRTDFGVEIELDPGDLVPQDGFARCHFAAGKIRYAPGSPSKDGVIIYMKPSLIKGDSMDLTGYRAIDPHFPHDSTADQWFDETRFESYRALGMAAGSTSVDRIKSEIETVLG